MDSAEYLEGLIKQFRDDVLDEYNNGNISKKEMFNIIGWTNKTIGTKKNITKKCNIIKNKTA